MSDYEMKIDPVRIAHGVRIAAMLVRGGRQFQKAYHRKGQPPPYRPETDKPVVDITAAEPMYGGQPAGEGRRSRRARRGPASPRIDEIEARITRIEQSIDTLIGVLREVK